VTIHEVQLHKEDDFIDSDTVAKLLGISKNNLRQIAYRKQLVPQGRQMRKSLFLIADVMALKTQRDKTKSPIGK
jgi:hypothetical protein